MRVLLRCDATSEAGVGHLVRCVALAEEVLARGGDAAISGTIEVPLAHQLLEGLRVEVIPATDDAGLATLARTRSADVVHIDHYGMGEDLRRPVGRAGAVLSSIEDGAYGRRPADLVVDSTLGAEEVGRPDDGSGEELLGVNYAPLRAVLRRMRAAVSSRDPMPAQPPEAPRVLVVLGGTDAFGVTAAAVRLCLDAGVRPEGLTVVAPRERHRDVLGVPGAGSIWVAEPDAGLPELAAVQDVVISAAGTTIWELACLGTATGIVAVTENQTLGYERAVDAGIALGIGSAAQVLEGAPAARARVSDLVSDPALRARLGATGRTLVDGRGATRIVEAWERAAGRIAVTIRAATFADADLLLTWRNDPGTRAASRSTEPVASSDHRAWLASALADDRRLLLVAERDGEPIGTVRFDRVDAELWEASITMAPAARGHGLAGRTLAAAESAWRSAVNGGDLLARVRPGNAPSVRLFETAGYRRAPERDTGDVITFVKDSPGT